MNNQINIPKPRILTGEDMLSEADRMKRAEIEIGRGIVRDEKGGIVLTPEQKEARIGALSGKVLTTKQTIEDAKNLIAIAEMQKEAEGATKETITNCDQQIEKQKAKLVILNQRLVDIDAKIKEIN